MAEKQQDTLRILIIDDMPEIHQSFIRILTPKSPSTDTLSELESSLFYTEDKTNQPVSQPPVDFILSSALQGKEGLEQIKQGLADGQPYALAFVDVRMPPGWDGIETIRHIWQIDPEIQIVLCTAYSDYDWETIITEFGIRDNLLILKKPFDAIAIRQIASALTKKWQLARETRENLRLLESRILERTQSLQDSLAISRGTLESSPDAILVFSHDDKLIDYNKKLTQFLNIPTLLLEQKKAEPLFKYIAAQLQKPALFNHFIRDITSKTADNANVINLTFKNQTIFEVTQQRYWMGQDHVGHIFSFRDITRRVFMENQILHQATHDALTNLANRSLLYDRIEYAIHQAKRNNIPFAVLYFDLNRFKRINDSLGHAVGDALLVDIATRLQERLRKTDTLARIGGDEFVIVAPGIRTVEHMKLFLNILLNQFEIPFIIQTYEILITTSVGIALYPNDGKNPDELLTNADMAMYTAKEIGGNRSNFYSAQFQARKEQLDLQFDFFRSLKNKEFFLCYQPQFELATHKLHGLEALVRWNHPQKGILYPVDFIEIAEDIGFILPLGEWILREACIQNKKWQDMGFLPMTVAVNMGTRQLKQPELAQLIKKILDETGLEPKYLELEITENALIDIVNKTQDIIALQKLGVKISLDDFGAGYSSLNYLRKIQVDRLKIDKSFIDKISMDLRDEQIIKVIISMGKVLGFNVIAEGVETQTQIDFLRANHCEDVQGFYFSKPLRSDEIDVLLAKNSP